MHRCLKCCATGSNDSTVRVSDGEFNCLSFRIAIHTHTHTNTSTRSLSPSPHPLAPLRNRRGRDRLFLFLEVLLVPRPPLSFSPSLPAYPEFTLALPRPVRLVGSCAACCIPPAPKSRPRTSKVTAFPANTPRPCSSLASTTPTRSSFFRIHHHPPPSTLRLCESLGHRHPL
jgi:hypothetical protein